MRNSVNEIFNYENLNPVAMSLYNDFVNVAWSLLGFYFIWILVEEFLLRYKSQKELMEVVLRLAVCSILLINITNIRVFFYDKTVQVANKVYDIDKVKDFSLPIINEAEDELNKMDAWDFLKENVVKWACYIILIIFKTFYLIVVFLLDFARKVGHFICIVLSPFAIVFYASSKTEKITIGFFKQFLSLCLWPVFISIVYKVLTTLTDFNFVINYSIAGFIQSICYLVVFTIILLKIPSFATGFIEGSLGVMQTFMNSAFDMGKSGIMLGAGLIGGAALLKLASGSGVAVGAVAGKNKIMEKALKVGSNMFEARHVSREHIYAAIRSGINKKTGRNKNEA